MNRTEQRGGNASTAEGENKNCPPSPFVFQHFPQLDGLRGLAITLVVVGHALDFGFGVRTDLGGFGVLLFFVLSGFLITGLLDSESAQTGQISLPAFYIRRGLRLFPALFFFLAALCALIKHRLVADTPWYTVVACLLYVRNIWGRGSATAQIWSLSLEEQFYACWPWVMKAFDRNIALRIAVITTAAITTFRMLAIRLQWFDYNTGLFYERSWFRFDSILLGCILALCLLRETHVGHSRDYLSNWFLSAGLWPAALAWSVWGEGLTHVWYLTVQMALVALILLNLLLSKESAYLEVFRNPVARWFGRVSYSWYLWQQLLTVLVYPRWKSPAIILACVAASLLLAVVSYTFVEKPFLKLKERLSQPSNVRASTCQVPA